MPFEEGNKLSSGRPKKEKSFAAMLKIAINEAIADTDKTKLRGVADALVEKAMNGDVQAIKEIADRLDGKPNQSVDVEHEVGGELADLLRAIGMRGAKVTDGSSGNQG